MMDIALLTANSNQLRFIMSYNMASKTYYLSLGLIIASLILQITVGFGLIYKVNIVDNLYVNRTITNVLFLLEIF